MRKIFLFANISTIPFDLNKFGVVEQSLTFEELEQKLKITHDTIVPVSSGQGCIVQPVCDMLNLSIPVQDNIPIYSLYDEIVFVECYEKITFTKLLSLNYNHDDEDDDGDSMCEFMQAIFGGKITKTKR